MEFKKYNSIDNSYREKTIHKIKELGYNSKDIEWVVLEKIHGANFSLWMNEEGIKPAKRTSFIDDTDGKFFNYDSVIDVYHENLRAIYELSKDMIADLVEMDKVTHDGKVEVILYGEIFGGNYGHDDVDKVSDAIKVQKGVDYCPHNDFYVFDMKINGRMLNYDLFREFMEATGFLYAKPLHRGTFEECVEYENEYQTTIPAVYGLPEIENNICEGNVIKPVHTLFFPSKDRVILKNKNDKFKESSREPKEKRQKKKEDITLSENSMEVLEDIRLHITENRLRNVISHIGEINNKMFGRLTGEFTKDTLEEYLKDNKEEYEKIEKAERKKIQKNISNLCAEVIRNNFVNIIDGCF